MKRNVLVTGAAGSLGRAAVEKFSREGYNVIATVAPGEVPAYDVPENVRVFSVNLQDEKSTDEFVVSALLDFQHVDVALFLVGGFASGDISATTGADLKKMISLNFETAYFASRRIFLQMLSQPRGGRIVFVGAKPGLEPEAGTKFLAYSLAKSLLFKFANMLNAEGRGKNVVSSVIVPSTIDTRANRAQMPDANFSNWVKPEQIADIMAFLTSPEADPLSGTVMKVYGNA